MTDGVYNFSPGPAALPVEVVEQVRKDLPSWSGLGYSTMEVSHRQVDFVRLMDSLEEDLRFLMRIPDDYSVVLVQGGASLQFSMLPMNLLGDGTSADYLVTGTWSEKAYKEASLAAPNGIALAATGKDDNFLSIPDRESWRLNPQAKYLHYTHNETIAGLMFASPPKVKVPLVSDISSCILSLPLRVSDFGMLYACTQKNMGPAGIAVAIIAPEMLRQCRQDLPSMLSYPSYVQSRSLQNTPPTFTCYVLALCLQWVRVRGGVSAMEEINRDKAQRLYEMIDASDFYANPIPKPSRSICNVAFTLANPALDDKFLAEAGEQGLANLRGHRTVGGMRASIYNAMPLEGVLKLLQFMEGFERRWRQ